VAGASQSFTAAASLPVGTAISSPMPVHARIQVDVQQGGLTGFGRSGILKGEGDKPKWMRWRTFERLAAKHDQFVRRSMQAMMLK
jgi:hypothetical protein